VAVVRYCQPISPVVDRLIVVDSGSSCAQEHQATPNGRLINFSVDRDLCVLPSRVINLCVTDTAIRQAYYYTAATGWGRGAGTQEID